MLVQAGAPVVVGEGPLRTQSLASAHDNAAVAEHLSGRHVEIVADLGLGSGSAVILTNDLTPGYIDENMRTS